MDVAQKNTQTKTGTLGLPIVDETAQLSMCGYDADYWVPYHRALTSTEVGQEVLTRLSSDQRVQALSGKLISRGAGAECFELNRLGMWFMWRANLVGMGSASAELEEFLSSKYIRAVNTLWITGLEVIEEIPLIEGFRILPASKMPNTRDRMSFISHTSDVITGMYSVPKAAIVVFSRVHSTWSKEPPEDGQKLADQFMADSSELMDIALVINICNGVFCVPYYSTSYLADSAPYGPFGGTGGGHPVYDVVAYGSVVVGPDLGAQVARLYSAFRKLHPEQKSHYRLILSRLGQAKRRLQLEDKILDLAIALEMLLLRDNSSKDQLSQSFRLRGSWLLGQNASERQSLYSTLKDFYRYRSDVAHGGSLSSKSRAVVADRYREFERITERVCEKLICDREPDWETLLLGATQ